DLSTGSPTNTGVGCGFITWSLARQPHLLARALDHKPAAVMCFTAGAFGFFILSNPAIGRCKESLRLLLGKRPGGLGGGLWHQRVTARLGDQDGRAGGVFLDLLPQPVDVCLERVSGEPGIVAPDFLQQCLARYRTLAGTTKISQDAGVLLR